LKGHPNFLQGGGAKTDTSQWRQWANYITQTHTDFHLDQCSAKPVINSHSAPSGFKASNADQSRTGESRSALPRISIKVKHGSWLLIGVRS